MTGKCKVALKNTFLLESLTKQHITINVITYPCFVKEYNQPITICYLLYPSSMPVKSGWKIYSSKHA
jgi:hypothetical protein